MKLISKTFPKCGAGLKFKATDREVTCDYCKQSFIIEDNSFGEGINFDPVLVEKFTEGTIKTMNKMTVVSTIIFAFVFLFIAVGMVFGMISFRNHFFPEKVEEKSDKNDFNLDYINSAEYIMDFSQLDEDTIITLSKQSMDELMKYSSVTGYQGGNWSYVGRYLLTTKEDKLLNVNMIYEVYKREYTKDDGTVRTGYAAVKFSDIIKLHGDIIVPSYTGVAYCPMTMVDSGTTNYIFGYESLENLYSVAIKDKLTTYNIKASDGMYM